MKQHIAWLIAVQAPVGFCFGEVKGEPGTPQLPGLPYHVHDANRP